MKKVISFLLLFTLILGFNVVSFADSSRPFEVTIIANYWGLNTGIGGDTLYTPYLKIDVRNLLEKATSKINVRVIFYNEAEKKVWSEETDYLVGSGDSPLRSEYSKTSFISSSVGYREKIDASYLPDVSAEIYINDKLYGLVDIEKSYDANTISVILNPDEETEEGAAPAEKPEDNELSGDGESEDTGSGIKADDFDLSGMSFSELVALKDRINLAIFATDEWQEVEVPAGVWEVGEDIPEGKWTITAPDGGNVRVFVGGELDETGASTIHYNDFWRLKSPSYSGFDSANDTTNITVDCKNGLLIYVESGYVTFSPFSGKPTLGFK